MLALSIAFVVLGLRIVGTLGAAIQVPLSTPDLESDDQVSSAYTVLCARARKLIR